MSDIKLPCTRCHRLLPLEDFVDDVRMTGRLGKRSWCAKCYRDYNRDRMRERRANPPEPKQKWYRDGTEKESTPAPTWLKPPEGENKP